MRHLYSKGYKSYNFTFHDSLSYRPNVSQQNALILCVWTAISPPKALAEIAEARLFEGI